MHTETDTSDGRVDDIHGRWIAFITAEDRSGTLSALAETFSSRGVSFESFHTVRLRDGLGVMAIIFRASERLARVIGRTLERVAVTRSVELLRASDPSVRAIAVVPGASGGTDAEVGATAASGTADGIITGSLAQVETRLDTDLHGHDVEALLVLPPE